MDAKQIILLGVQISILATVFSYGLQATAGDLLYVFRRPGLLARSLLAVFVIMPIVAVALIRLFNFSAAVEIVLAALAISPVPPLLPRKEAKAGGAASFGLGLMATFALVAIAAVPVSVAFLGWLFNRPFALATATIASTLAIGVLLPLLAGVLVRAALPALADRLVKPVSRLARVLLPIAVVALVAGAVPAMWALIGDGTVLALTIFTLAGLAIGHILGGPETPHSVVVALSTACRHPAIALTVAASNFPEYQFGPIILLYLIVNALAAIPYLKWQQQTVASAAPAT